MTEEDKYFAGRQGGRHDNVEHALEVLQGRLHIVALLCKLLVKSGHSYRYLLLWYPTKHGGM